MKLICILGKYYRLHQIASTNVNDQVFNLGIGCNMIEVKLKVIIYVLLF